MFFSITVINRPFFFSQRTKIFQIKVNHIGVKTALKRPNLLAIKYSGFTVSLMFSNIFRRAKFYTKMF